MATWIFPVANPKEWNPGSYMDKHTKGNRTHYAIDIYAKRGNAVFSPVAGKVLTVTTTKNSKLGGNTILIKGNDGFTYYFAHMKLPTNYKVGQSVSAGAQIGMVGNTGSANGTTPHLHFSMKRGTSAINPTSYLKGGGVVSTPSSSTRGKALGNVTVEEQKQLDIEGIDQVTPIGAGWFTQRPVPTFEGTDADVGLQEIPAWVEQLRAYIAEKENQPIEDIGPNRRASDNIRAMLRGMGQMVRRYGFETGSYAIHPEEPVHDVQRLDRNEEPQRDLIVPETETMQ